MLYAFDLSVLNQRNIVIGRGLPVRGGAFLYAPVHIFQFLTSRCSSWWSRWPYAWWPRCWTGAGKRPVDPPTIIVSKLSLRLPIECSKPDEHDGRRSCIGFRLLPHRRASGEFESLYWLLLYSYPPTLYHGLMAVRSVSGQCSGERVLQYVYGLMMVLRRRRRDDADLAH